MINKYSDNQQGDSPISFIVDQEGAQADAVLAYCCHRKFSDATLSADTDFLAVLGKNAVLLKDFNFAKSKQSVGGKQLSKIVVGTASPRVFEKCKLSNYKCPPLPIFERESNPRVRAIAAVAIGSDVWKGGIPQCGVANAFKVYRKMDERYLKG